MSDQDWRWAGAISLALFGLSGLVTQGMGYGFGWAKLIALFLGAVNIWDLISDRRSSKGR